MWNWRVASGAGRFSGKLVICFSTICTYHKVLLSSWYLSVSDPWLWQGSGCGMTNLIRKEMWWCWLWGHSICEVSTGDFQTREADSIALSALQVMSHLYKPCEHDWRHLIPWVMPSIHENYIDKVHSITSFYKNFFGFFSSLKKKSNVFTFLTLEFPYLTLPVGFILSLSSELQFRVCKCFSWIRWYLRVLGNTLFFIFDK